MAALLCPCEKGAEIWGEVWWGEGSHRWVFFDDDRGSETYAEHLTHCTGCGGPLDRNALRRVPAPGDRP